MLGCAFSVFGTDIHAMRNHKKESSRAKRSWLRVHFNFWWQVDTVPFWQVGFRHLSRNLRFIQRQGNACCCLITRAWHPCWKSLACLVRFTASKHVVAFCCEWWWYSEVRSTPYCIHNTKEFTHDSLYMRVIVNVIFYVGGYGIVLHSYCCCFTESVIYIYITYEHMFNYSLHFSL